MKSLQLNPNQMILLFLTYHKDFESIKSIFGIQEAINIRNSLCGSDFILSDNTVKFTETLLSKKHVEKLFGIRGDGVNFWEFYNCYPIRVGTRVLRSSGPTTQIALKHEKKYLARVKTVEQHQTAIASIRSFVGQQKLANKLNFLPNMETVMNNSMWEQWEVFIKETGKEEQEWNTESI
jgi:hypothetical protein